MTDTLAASLLSTSSSLSPDSGRFAFGQLIRVDSEVLTHLNRLILDRMVRVVDVLERDAVELALVDVRDAVVLPPLRRADGTLQTVAKADVRVAAKWMEIISNAAPGRADDLRVIA